MPEEKFTQGCFVDDDGIVRDVAAPGRDLTCVVAGGVVDLCGPFVEGDGREVIGSYTFYPSLDSLAAAGFRPGPEGHAVEIELAANAPARPRG
jgi:hypothetical protein